MARKSLLVSLNTNAMNGAPAVEIDERDCVADKKNLRWEPAPGALNFDFWRLNDLDQAEFPYQGITSDRQRVFCNNEAPDTTEEFEYTIVVKYNNVLYDSTDRSGTDPNPKPVIRNK